ncbi:MAG TPA: CHY zinc finger protein [Rhizomicrobium sp.]|nr:CHY zinc finger protein [Rhizomicrobium sp.]
MTRPKVHGVALDAETRCAHWRSALDVVAIRMKCCGVYYACKDCHEALTGHAIEIWPRGERDAVAVLCGACGFEMTIGAYLSCGDRCPACGAGFNPGCRLHRRFYFET